MNPEPSIPSALAADHAKWQKKRREAEERELAALKGEGAFTRARDELINAFKAAPEKVTVPYHLTPEGERLTRFRLICPEEFKGRIDRTKLKNPAAFDRVAEWNGTFPGPIASGSTGCSKTRAAWSAMGRLWVKENRAFAWFPVKRLITEFERYEGKDMADEFWRYYRGQFSLLLVDDLDKINWSFDSQHAVLFQFYDWVYAHHIPVITTTNKNRAWWTDKMGEPFVRRLFDEACFEVQF